MPTFGIEEMCKWKILKCYLGSFDCAHITITLVLNVANKHVQPNLPYY